MPLYSQQQGLYDRKVLLDIAATLGVPITSRSLTGWIERGLVPPPEQRGLGQGKGSIAGWTRAQVIVWLILLLNYKQDGLFKGLCNLPVYGWLYGGEAIGISLAQVQRAMRYWAQSQPVAIPQRQARLEARRQVKVLARPASKGVSALVRELAAWYGGQDLDLTELEYLLGPVIDLQSPQVWWGDTASHAAAVLLGNKTLRELALANLARIPSPLWEWARTQILVENAEQQLGEEALEKALASGSCTFWHPAGKELPSSCHRLLTMLGVGYFFTQQPMPPQGFPPALHPAYWEDGVRTARLESRLELSPSPSLDDFQSPMHFIITITLMTCSNPARDGGSSGILMIRAHGPL